jgi:signal transduction histidine kinase
MSHFNAADLSAAVPDIGNIERPILTLVGADGTPQIREFLTQPAQANHIVQFYEDDGFLVENVAHFLGAGLAAGEPTVVIATEAHRRAFTQRLKLNAFDVEQACATRTLILLDARTTLARFMVGHMPDWIRFQAVIGGVIEQARLGRPQARVRAYGEMVDLLWRDGNRPAAVRLEEMWNDLAKSYSFSLLCAYVMGNFHSAGDGEEFRQVCGAHSHVIPAEGYSRIETADARLREISLLQQRASALESEIERRKELEIALREALSREQEARAAAEHTVRYNEMFAGMLGHDLRNPLNAITTAAYYIAKTNPGAKTGTAATRIISSSERMARMIDQLLDFTQIRIGNGIALRITRVDLLDLCHRIRDELEAAHPECAIALEAEGNTVGEWDYDRLLQVLSNLVGNAIHHGSSGCRVSIRSDGTSPSRVTLEVHNEGTVAPDMLPLLFEPFRGTAKQHKTRGLGLGLYITRQIVAAHGGTVDVVSTPADGTTFRVQLSRTTPRSANASPGTDTGGE